MKRFSRAPTATSTTDTPNKKKPRKPPARFKGTDHWITKEQLAEVVAAGA
jgi:hypothetical protein